ncbi:MAG TPA: hypothetical protein DEB06_07930 [Phycisphaerales bacterium]|nr:hypothetical protein [Phycisphaerales bacterium]
MPRGSPFHAAPAYPPPMPIDTKKAPRRSLRFASINDLRQELDRVERAHRAGAMRSSGNWSVGKNLGHLAYWIDFSFDGPPPGFKKPPLFMRWFFRMGRKMVLNGRMPAGVRLGGVPAGTYGTDEMSTEDGLARLRVALDRLEQNTPTQPSPAFGALTRDEWTALHLRHSELHLGFLELGATAHR